MKKMSKMGKSILLSSLAIIAFGGIAAGTTYALFTSEAETAVSVTTGKVAVGKTVTLVDGYTLDNDVEKTATSTDGKSITFGCGGTATINADGNVELKNIVAGDKVTVKVHATNSSSVNIKYRAVVKATGDFKDIVTLSGKTNATDDSTNATAMKVSETGLFTNYKEAKSTDTELDYYYLTFGIDKDTKVEGETEKSGTVTITIDAIQGNAAGKNVTEKLKIVNVEELKTALTSDSVDVANKVIEVPETINLTDTLTVSNTNAEIVLSPSATIEAPTDKPAFNVTSGTVTLSAAPVSSGTGAKGRNRYLASLANDTDTIPIITSAKNAIIAEGKGSKVIIDGVKIVSTGASAIVAKNGGEVVVKSGEVEAQEVAVLVYGGSTATIDNGTFTTKDNFVVGTNGTKGWGGNTITINGGVFNGNISSNGYIACGVYVANSDTVNIKGGTFNITNGCGVLARSGNTTVSDDVVFNFTNSENGITEGWVGDTKIKLPVNAKIIKDLVAGYPGGTPTVDGKEVIELNQKDGKAYLVSDEASLRTAINDENNATKYIYLKNNITLEQGRLDIITKYTTVYGNGKTTLTVDCTKITKDNQKRVFNLDGEDHEDALKDGSFSLVGVKAKTSDADLENKRYGEGRIISSYQLSDFIFVLDSVELEAKYPFNIGEESTSVIVKAKNVSSTGYCAFQTYASESTKATFENCTLTGNNLYKYGADNMFATILAEVGVSKASFTFSNCEINANNQNGETLQNVENLLRAKSGSSGSSTFNGCKFNFNNAALSTKKDVSELVSIEDEESFTWSMN